MPLNTHLVKSYIPILLLILVLGSCSEENVVDHNLELVKYEWMVGSWNSTLDPAIWEIWELDSTELRGVSIKIIGLDSAILEKMKIQWKDTTFVFFADVSENLSVVEFVLTNSEENRLHFQNPKHDFPKEISYQKIGLNSLKAQVTGDHKSIDYLFIKR